MLHYLPFVLLGLVCSAAGMLLVEAGAYLVKKLRGTAT